MDVLDIHDQLLSTLLSDFLVCQYCGIVDRDHERMRVGYLCPQCGSKSPGGRSYFGIAVDSLINLMQETYHLGSKASDAIRIKKRKNNTDYQLSIVIFFCTLVEVLLEHFLRELMIVLDIPRLVQERLMADNLFVKQRVEKLFPSLTGDKWKTVVKKLSASVQLNYEGTENFCKKAIKARNDFLHRGSKWAIPSEMPKKCMQQIWSTLNLYVSLHNHYIPALYKERNH